MISRNILKAAVAGGCEPMATHCCDLGLSNYVSVSHLYFQGPSLVSNSDQVDSIGLAIIY